MNSIYDLRLIRIQDKGPGAQARDFLQRLSTLDFRPPWLHRPGFFLSPTGKSLAAYDVWREDDGGSGRETFWFEVPHGMAEAFLAFVEKFKFSERFECEVLTWLPSWERAELETPLLGRSGDTLRLKRKGFPWALTWGPETLAGAPSPASSSEDAGEVDAWRVENRFPWPGAEITPESNPLETGPREGLDDRKGCFPGQEVIEKILSIGSPARRLVRVACQPTDRPGTPVLGPTGLQIGVMTTIGSQKALALVQKSAAQRFET